MLLPAFSELDALFWTQKLIVCAIILQACEFLLLRHSFSDHGIWPWTLIRREFQFFPKPISATLDFFLSYPRFVYFLLLQLLVAFLALVFPCAPLFLILLAGTVLILLRWRGTFNGGSDFMTLIVLMAICIASLFPEVPRLSVGCLWYIAIQTCSSYFIAGVTKLQTSNWRRGHALNGFLNSTIYGPLPALKFLSQSAFLSLILSWFVIGFECLFPLALIHPSSCLVLLGFAFAFHLANFYVFGLNRFVWAWAATYPALYFCSLYRVG